jgi:anaerobic magnesium-protoporphyrin IX monomethyl ester cyclase
MVSADRSPRAVLIYPPLFDPTAGYHSLGYLKSYAAARGYRDVHVVDANVEAVAMVLEPAEVNRYLSQLASRRDELAGRRERLSPAESMEYGELRKLDLVSPESIEVAVRVLRTPDQFYDYPSYRAAVERIISWLALLATLGVPGQFSNGFVLQPVGWSPSSSADLCDESLLATVARPFGRYFAERLIPRIVALRPDLVGVNLTYVSQTPFALHLLRELRQRLPSCHITAGGTELADIWKYLADRERFFKIFDNVDSCVLGEGEGAFGRLLEHLAGQRPVDQLGPGTLLHPRHAPVAAPSTYAYEVTRQLPPPDLADLPYEKYLSPHRYAYFSPTRGCYWNKCTFCDYGLNDDAPTSPWRQDPVDKAMRDLRAVAGQARFVYLSVDVLAPATILRLAEQIIDAGLDVRWGAEIRLERYWTPQRCRTLYASGCRAVSVGFESASQRVLDLIAKGTRVVDVPAIIEAMTDAGIGVQMMGFTGFPSETFGEAMESVRFLASHRREWTLGDLGEFVLTPGSIVAREPHRFGVSNLRTRPGRDIRRALRFDPPSRLGDAEESDLAAAKRRLRIADFDRPWLGGVDTPHTYFYHDRYGAHIVMQLSNAVASRAANWQGNWRLNGIVVDDAALATDRWGRLRSGTAGGTAPATYLVRADGVPFRLTTSQAAVVQRWRAGGPAPSGGCRKRLVRAHLLVPSAAPVVA